MAQVTWWQCVVGFVGVLAVGGLGSGVWEVIFKPLYGVITRSALWIVTLGYKSVRDSLYIEAAKGRNDRSILLLVQIAIVICIPYTLNSSLVRMDAQTLRRTQDVIVVQALLDHLHTTEEYKAMTDDQRKEEDKQLEMAKKINQINVAQKTREDVESLRRSLKVYEWAWLINLGVFIFPCFILIRSARLFLINAIISDYRQRFAICRPFLSQVDQWMIESRFAAMQSREEYSKLMLDIKKTVKIENFQLPNTLFG